jgi:hypothetical protein
VSPSTDALTIRHGAQRLDRRLDDERQECELGAAAFEFGLLRLADLRHSREVDLEHRMHVRGRPTARHHVLGDPLAHRRHLLDAIARRRFHRAGACSLLATCAA